MTNRRPTAVIVVDLRGRNGICSHCNSTVLIDTAHPCGARVTGLAINSEYAMDPTLRQAWAVSDMKPKGVEFVGVGRVVRTNGGYRFEPTKRPGLTASRRGRVSGAQSSPPYLAQYNELIVY